MHGLMHCMALGTENIMVKRLITCRISNGRAEMRSKFYPVSKLKRIEDLEILAGRDYAGLPEPLLTLLLKEIEAQM